MKKMFRKGIFGSSKPKSVHSLENLKHLYNVLVRHQTVTESNRALLVETLRSISEILIWGDQNDSTVFDYFLEKNMLVFFIKYLEQKSGQYISVQLLQTLNILFENISNETSVYFLLSNNHVNSIICHQFDFTDEEVMAYYISFMKTLSLRLNSHTIHFFFNEQSEDFPLYTEAIKFFNHSESMVRIAVRTITLNVYRVDNPRMQAFIREKTSVAYFSNLVWYMGNHVLELDSCVRHDIDHKSRDRLTDLVAEHLDHLHYLNDILCLDIEHLNNVLTDFLLNRLYIPLYVMSLTPNDPVQMSVPHVSSAVALFLLSQVFLIIHHKPLVRRLITLIMGLASTRDVSPVPSVPESKLHPTVARFVAPDILLSEDFVHTEKRVSNSTFYSSENQQELSIANQTTVSREQTANTTDDEKIGQDVPTASCDPTLAFSQRPFMKSIFECLDAVDDDFSALLALCLLYAIGENTGINQELLDTVSFTTRKSLQKEGYNELIVEKLILIITLSSQFAGKVRLATLELAIMVLNMLVVMDDGRSCLHDNHYATLLGTKEESMALLRNVFKTEEMFLDMFEDEFREMSKRKLNVEYLTMDASILLQPTNTPLTGIEFTKRLPCGEVERVRKAIRVFFHTRKLLQALNGDIENQLPLTKPSDSVKIGDVLDLNNSDLIGCTIVKENSSKKERRFLVIDITQLIMVEPDASRLGWGVVRFSGYLQDVEVTGDKDDSRCLHISIHKPASSHLAKPLPLLTAKFIFDDHIRCMAAKQRLTKGRSKARQRKMTVIANMLEIPASEVSAVFQPATAVPASLFSTTHRPLPGRVVAQVVHRPRSGGFTSASAQPDQHPVEKGLDVSKSDVYQALNSNSMFAVRESNRRSSESASTEDVEITSIPLKDMSRSSTQVKLDDGEGDVSTQSDSNHDQASQQITSSTVIEHSPVSVTSPSQDKRLKEDDSQSSASPILPFGADKSELKDV